MSVQRFLKLDEALELLNNLDSNEIGVEIAVLTPDASELTGVDEGAENEVNTNKITENYVPGSLEENPHPWRQTEKSAKQERDGAKRKQQWRQVNIAG
ncbi:hypothetical protein TNCV_2303441 [Trichonephila clavipes]|nr:hypothetical protein TNCV_2303441 [Trichonephila clavipes]